MIMTHKEFRLRAIKKVIYHAWVFRYLFMDNKMNDCLLYLVLLKYGLKQLEPSKPRQPQRHPICSKLCSHDLNTWGTCIVLFLDRLFQRAPYFHSSRYVDNMDHSRECTLALYNNLMTHFLSSHMYKRRKFVNKSSPCIA